MSIEMDDLENLFTYHPPQDGDVEAYAQIRSTARLLAEVIIIKVPSSPERDTAIERLRESVMWANAGRACNPDLPRIE